MRLFHVPLRNLRLRALAAVLTGASIALGTGLVAFLWIAADQTEQRYRASVKGFPIVVGPVGTSPLDLVLNTVFNLGMPRGVVPLSVYRDLRDDTIVPGRRLGVRHAIPIAVGDSYRGYRVVATTDEFFPAAEGQEERLRLRRGDLGPLAFAEGRGFRFSHEELMELAGHLAEHHGHSHGHHGHDHHHCHDIPDRWKEVVLGAEVAARLGMRLGDEVVPAHGVGDTYEEHPEAASRVVGILEATGTPIDRAVYMPLGTFYLLEGHDAVVDPEAPSAVEAARISAVVVDVRHPLGFQHLRHAFQNRPVAQAAFTADEIHNLFSIVGNVTLALKALGVLVMFVAGIGILVALYNTMNDRRREIAIMRSLGARRSQILVVVLAEATLIAAAGAVVGVAAAHGVGALLSGRLEDATGVAISGASFSVQEVWLILGATALGALAGILPAVKASMTEVAENLSPTT